MQIKTYKAASMKDILSKIKSELWSNAVILSRREVADPAFGISAKPLIEVTAAVDYDAAMYDRQANVAAFPSFQKPAQQMNPGVPDDISSDIIELKEMMRELLSHTNSTLNEKNPVRSKLIAKGIRQNLVDAILTKLGKDANAASVKDLMTKIIKTEAPSRNKVWAFVGTTGVGKTTTIAKIAARCVLGEHRKTALVTLDTYRIGAVDQGRIYAKILNIPFLSVNTVSEFRSALAKLDSMDLILVDTVGRSPLFKEYIPQLREHFDGINPCTFLLMPVATRDSEMDTITKTYAGLDLDRMIFTKLDEAVSTGSIITHNLIHRIPVSFVTTGQRVPEDIEETTASTIIDRCLGDIA